MHQEINDQDLRRLEHYHKLLGISKDLVSSHDLDRMLEKITSTACELSNAEAASILLYDDRVKELYFQTATGLDEPLLHGLSVPLEGSIAGWVVKNQEKVLINDVHADPRFFRGVEQKTRVVTRSLAGLPLFVQDKVIGILEVINHKNGGFTEYDIEILSILASQAALAIENTRLFQQSDQISELVHEIRTPLSSISTAAFLLQQSTVDFDHRISLARTIHSEAQRLSELATTFLDLARLESGRTSFKPTWFKLLDLVVEVVDMFSAGSTTTDISFSVKIPDHYPDLFADREKIKQVFINLVSNAVKYNHKSGLITISAEMLGNDHQICIRDNGIGMSSEIVDHLFEKFYRAHNTEDLFQGTGLGLSICKKIIENHNGQIEVSSELGKGTTFKICLPSKDR